MISKEKWMILTSLQKLPNNVGDWGKIIIATGFKWLPKVQKIAQSGHTDLRWWPLGLLGATDNKIDVKMIYEDFSVKRLFFRLAVCSCATKPRIKEFHLWYVPAWKWLYLDLVLNPRPWNYVLTSGLTNQRSPSSFENFLKTVFTEINFQVVNIVRAREIKFVPYKQQLSWIFK